MRIGYYAHVVHQDVDAILRDIREKHRTVSTTADVDSAAAEGQKQLQEAMSFEGSDAERQVRVLCNQLGIPYDKLMPAEFAGLISALQKSEIMKTAKRLRGKGNPTQGKGKRKRK